MPQQIAWWKGERGEWYVIAQVLLLGLVLVSPWGTRWFPVWPSAWTLTARLAGAVGLGLAAAIFLAGVFRLGRNLSPLPYPKDQATFIETGIYGFIRHPLYSGLIGLSLGWALFMASTPTLLCAALVWVFFEAKVRREEKWLLTTFPAYAAYRCRVRKFIPWIY